MAIKPYPKYKDSEVEWIGKIPEHWDIIRIRNLTKSVANGVWGKEPQGNDYDVTCIRVADFNRDFSSLSDNNTIRNVTKKELESRQLKSGDLLIEKSGGGDLLPVGRVGIYEKNNDTAVCSNFMARVRPINEKVNSKWLFYLFKTTYNKRVNLGAIKQTTGIQNLDTYDYFVNKVCLPTLPEQQTIATYLDRKTKEIDDTIAKKQWLIELLEEERKATINEAVTKGLNPNVKMKDSGIEWIGEIPEHWYMKKLKYVTYKIGSGVTPKGGAEVYQKDGIPLIRSQNVHYDGIWYKDMAYISDEINNSMSNSQVFSNDVLLNITGASIGRTCHVPENFEGGNVNQHVCIIRSNNEIESKYLFLFLSSDKGQIQIKLSQTGSGREGLNFENLKNFVTPIPNLQEQKNILKKLYRALEEIVTSIKKIQTQIELLKEYRQSLIFEAVTGKIDVREEVKTG